MEILTPVQVRILESLARYKFLTVSQLLKLNIQTEPSSLNKSLRRLKGFSKPLVETASFGVHVKLGKLQNVHFLTVHGKKLLVEDLRYPESDVRIPVGKVVFTHDYFHRIATVDAHIQFDTWATDNDLNLPFFDTYFDFTGNRRTANDLASKTTIVLKSKEIVVPDAVFAIRTPWTTELYALEIYMGADSGRVIKQLEKHAQVMAEGALAKSRGVEQHWRVVSVFERETCMESVVNQFKERPALQLLRPYFLFKTLDHLILGEVFTHWKDGAGEEVNLFYNPEKPA